MFKVLQAHEEREPKAVLKTQSKRAQKRLTRQEARREEADRLNAASNNGNSQFGGADTRRPSSSLSADDVKEQQQIALHMYEELFSQGDVDPGLCDDIAAQLGRMHLPPAGPAAAACAAGGGSDWGSGHEEAAASLASTRTAELANLRRRVDSPPGPGPGSGFESPWPEPKPNPGGLAGKWLTRKGSAPPLFWPDPPSSSGSPRAAGAASTSASRSRGAGSILLRFGSGASFGAEGAAAASCAAAAAAGGGGGGQLGESHGSPAAPAQLFTRDSFQQLRGRAAGSEAEVEEFPELQATVSAEQPPPPPQGKQQQPQRQQGQQGQHLSHAHRRGPGGGGSSGRHAGRCQGGVKVLHRSSNGRSQPLCNGGSRGGGGGGGGGDDESATGFSLSLLWDLIQGGLCLRGDPLAAEGGDLRGPEPDVAVAIKRLVRARCPEEPDDAPVGYRNE
ncbi:hypothetical protein PLESTB_000563100 [Pleodorina starrii]|uniref:Uncharacterized protein n=1 Tax=Pleodorina starrii TaxID=330485 RepID=A0A9W6BHJ1_9CHLO|nr:hypothetical protein PLESTB_000563100 [Pleodorina starrii]